ncbi:hypothetical protein RQP46_011135 [Phenoliferia psychrophenolica]
MTRQEAAWDNPRPPRSSSPPPKIPSKRPSSAKADERRATLAPLSSFAPKTPIDASRSFVRENALKFRAAANEAAVPIPIALDISSAQPKTKASGFTGSKLQKPQPPPADAPAVDVPFEFTPSQQDDWEAIQLANPKVRGFTYIPRQEAKGAITILCDEQGRRFALRAQEPAWAEEKGITKSFAKECAKLGKKLGEMGGGGRRGATYKTTQFGVWCDGGMTKPGYSKTFVQNEQRCIEFLQHASTARIHGWISSLMEDFFPEMHGDYRELDKYLSEEDLHILGGPFSSICVNTGGKTITDEHADTANRLFGLCASLTQKLKSLRHQRGGHLVLNEARVVIELAPGDLLLFPSAMFTHWNIPLSEATDSRNSVAWWSSGSLFLVQELGGRTLSQLSKEERRVFNEGKAARIEKMLSRFPVHGSK